MKSSKAFAIWYPAVHYLCHRTLDGANYTTITHCHKYTSCNNIHTVNKLILAAITFSVLKNGDLAAINSSNHPHNYVMCARDKRTSKTS